MSQHYNNGEIDAVSTDTSDSTVGNIIAIAYEQGWLTTVSIPIGDAHTIHFNFERDCPRNLSTPILVTATMTDNDVDGFLMDLAEIVTNYNTDYLGLYADTAIIGEPDVDDYSTICDTADFLRTEIANLVAALAMAL